MGNFGKSEWFKKCLEEGVGSSEISAKYGNTANLWRQSNREYVFIAMFDKALYIPAINQ